MFAMVSLGAAADGPRVTRPVVPQAAVVTDGTERYVFVELEPGTFERRTVQVEPLGDGDIVILSGLEAGERVVVEGAFTLNSELAKDEFGGHQH
jgi:cobalt-zinc-cadmium efflux system membrane fusion protein